MQFAGARRHKCASERGEHTTTELTTTTTKDDTTPHVVWPHPTGARPKIWCQRISTENKSWRTQTAGQQQPRSKPLASLQEARQAKWYLQRSLQGIAGLPAPRTEIVTRSSTFHQEGYLARSPAATLANTQSGDASKISQAEARARPYESNTG